MLYFSAWDAGLAVLPPLIMADFFEGPAYGSIFGTIWALNSVAMAFGAWFGGFLHDHVENYIPFFVIVMACGLFACFNIWIAAPRKIRIVSGKRFSGLNGIRPPKIQSAVMPTFQDAIC